MAGIKPRITHAQDVHGCAYIEEETGSYRFVAVSSSGYDDALKQSGARAATITKDGELVLGARLDDPDFAIIEAHGENPKDPHPTMAELRDRLARRGISMTLGQCREKVLELMQKGQLRNPHLLS